MPTAQSDLGNSTFKALFFQVTLGEFSSLYVCLVKHGRLIFIFERVSHVT